MNASWMSVFGAAFGAIAQVALIAMVAAALVKKRIVEPGHVRGLSVVTVNVFLPCLIFSNITRTFDPEALPGWWMLPLAAAGTIGIGLVVAGLLFMKELPDKLNVVAVAAFQNAAFLVLPIGKVLFPQQFDTFALYVFLYILAFNPLLWSLGKHLVTRQPGVGLQWRSLVTPPLCACVLALILALTEFRRFIPTGVIEPMALLGSATVPVGTFVLGATIGSITLRWSGNTWDLGRVILCKLIIMPAIVAGILALTPLPETQPLLAAFLMLEASSAPAANLVIQIQAYGGDLDKTGTLMLASYSASLFTIPFWYAIWAMMA